MRHFSKSRRVSPVRSRRFRHPAARRADRGDCRGRVDGWRYAQDVTLRMSREIESPYRRWRAAPGALAPEATAPRVERFDRAPACRAPSPPAPRAARARHARRSAAPSTCAPTVWRATPTSASKPRARSSCARAARPCSRTGCTYDIENDEIYAKGDVTLRKGLDWISGPEVKFQREREIGYFDEPRFFISENQSHGEAKEIRFAGPNLYEASKAQYTTCVAPNNDWYLRSDEIEVDKLRKVGTAHDASVYFLGVPVMYTPWLEFPLSNERKSGFLTPTIGSTQIRGFEFSAPYYFNLAPNYDATVTPRIMTRRGIQIARPGTLPVRSVRRRGRSARSCRRIASRTTTRWAVVVEAQPAVRAVARRATSTTTACPTRRTSPTTPTASSVTSQKTLPQEAGSTRRTVRSTVLARVQAFQTLQDPNPAAYVTPPYNMLPQVKAVLNETDWLGLTWSGTRRVRALRAVGARCRRASAQRSFRPCAGSARAARGS